MRRIEVSFPKVGVQKAFKRGTRKRLRFAKNGQKQNQQGNAQTHRAVYKVVYKGNLALTKSPKND
jgi:hypothetical protein